MEPFTTLNAARAARAYTGILNWPVTVGYRHRPRQGCTCGRANCPTPGAHPPPGPLAFPGQEEFDRQLEAAPGAALIAPTTIFDALVVPQAVGMCAMIALDRVAPVPCLVDNRRAYLLVLPATGRYAVTDAALPIEVRTGPEQWVALPPTHGVRWDTHPWIDQTTVPAPLLNGRDIGRHLMEAFDGCYQAEGARG